MAKTVQITNRIVFLWICKNRKNTSQVQQFDVMSMTTVLLLPLLSPPPPPPSSSSLCFHLSTNFKSAHHLLLWWSAYAGLVNSIKAIYVRVMISLLSLSLLTVWKNPIEKMILTTTFSLFWFMYVMLTAKWEMWPSCSVSHLVYMLSM